MTLPKRKPNRLNNYNYNTNGCYFVTICVKHREKILSRIVEHTKTNNVGAGVLDCPQIKLLKHGIIADKYINQLNDFYDNVTVDKYVIMPDHIHLLLSVLNGQSGTPVPTNNNCNIVVSNFVSTFKRYCNKDYGANIWQRSFYDHIIRNQNDYNEVWQYIDNNQTNWVLKNQSPQNAKI